MKLYTISKNNRPLKWLIEDNISHIFGHIVSIFELIIHTITFSWVNLYLSDRLLKKRVNRQIKRRKR
jgi:hypothetical protein